MKCINLSFPLALFLLLSTLLCSSSPASAGEGEYTEIWMLAEDGVTHLTFTVPSDYIITVTPERSESLYSMPDEVLSASTPELLEAFLNSRYMKEWVFSPIVAATFNAAARPPENLYRNEGFLELSSRDDFLTCLDDLARRTLSGDEDVSTLTADSFRLLLLSDDMSALADVSFYGTDNYPYLRELYASLETAPSSVDSTDTMGQS